MDFLHCPIRWNAVTPPFLDVLLEFFVLESHNFKIEDLLSGDLYLQLERRGQKLVLAFL